MSAEERLWDVWHIRLLNADLEVMHEIHVVPYADVVEHENYAGCVCRPVRNPQTSPSVRTFKHASLDGREHEEARHVTA